MKITITDFPHTQMIRREYKEGQKRPTTTTGPWVIIDQDMEELMPPAMYKQFCDFMSGQTVLMIGLQAGYYLEDVERFLKGKGVID